MKLLAAVIAAAVLASASAMCPNSCSGHGTCGANDACSCDPNFVGADCSERLCVFGLAYVDTPLGDLNHNGAVSVSDTTAVRWSNAVVNEQWPGTENGEAHGYRECSGRGMCDRAVGECKCYDGYTGSACQRTECPNSCSGHGVCRSLAEVASQGLNARNTGSRNGEIIQSGVTTSFTYSLWDADVYHTCVCDPGYSGYDCSLRECPRGDDPLTTGSRFSGNEDPHYAELTFTLTPGAPSVSVVQFDYTGWDGRTTSAYATIDSQNDSPGLRDTSVTPTKLPGLSTIAGKMMQALRNLPGGQLQKVEVYGDDSGCTPGAACEYTVKFTNRPGKQNLLGVSVVVGGATISTAPAFATDSDGVTLDGNREEITCSGRGLCDYDAGLCSCFQGYYGAACEYQNALSTGGAAPRAGGASAASILGIDF